MSAPVFGRVLYNYAASHYDELSIRFNQIVTVVSENTGADGWWEVQLQGKKGKVPANYIEVIPEPRGKRAQCMYDHTFEEITGQYLPFKRGDVITVISEDPDGWWLGYADEQQGLFPQEYVQLLSDEIMAPVRSEVASVSSTSEPTTPRTTDASDDDDDDDLNPLHEALGEVLHDRDMSVIETLCVILDPASSEKMANVVVPIFEHEGKIMDLCQATIDQEIKRTTKASTLFRTNSFASQVMRCYARLCGKDYLTNMLEPLIRQLNEMDGSVEIDPRKLNEDPKYKNLDENLANLKRMCQLFVDAIVNSLKKVPVALNYVSAALVEGVEFKFPEAVRVVIAGFFFLRFLCPAIVSPEGYDIIPKGFLNARGRRGLVLVSKVVQNLANSVEFGNKEEFMKPMNEFVVANFSKINFVLDELPNIPDSGDIEALPRMPVKELTKNYVQLHEILSDNLDKIRKQFEEAGRDMEVFQDLALAVRQLGPTSAQVRQMEVKHKELMVEDDEKRRQKKKADKEEEKKRKEEEKKKREEDKKKKEEEKEKKKGDKKAEKSAKKAKEEEENSVLMPPGDSKIMCEGYLSKQTSAAIGKRWKKKYFVLYSGQPRIHYYDSQSVAGAASPLAGVFCLLPTFFVQTLTKTKHHPGFPFLIKTTSDEYQLVAHTEGELRMWITTLNRTLTNIATPPTPGDAAILKSALDRKIMMQEAEAESVQAAYQAAKDDDTRSKCLSRAELLQTSISACRLARQKLTKASGGSARDDDTPLSTSSSSSSAAGLAASSGSASTASTSLPSLTSSAPAATTGGSAAAAAAASGSTTPKTKPPVTRTKPPVVRPGGAAAPAATAAAAPSPMAAMSGAGVAAGGGGMRAAGMPVAAAGGRAAAVPGAMMGQLPAGMTMQQYQMYQQQQQQLRYQQQLQYQQQMAARAQNPYGWQ